MRQKFAAEMLQQNEFRVNERKYESRRKTGESVLALFRREDSEIERTDSRSGGRVVMVEKKPKRVEVGTQIRGQRSGGK